MSNRRTEQPAVVAENEREKHVEQRPERGHRQDDGDVQTPIYLRRARTEEPGAGGRCGGFFGGFSAAPFPSIKSRLPSN